MASIILPSRWRSQPSYPVDVDAAFGVSGAFIPAQRGLFPTTSGSPSLAAGRFGAELRSSSNNAAVHRAAEPALLTPAASVMWVGTFYGAATTDGSLGGLTHNSTNASPYVGIELKRLKAGGGTGNIYLTWNNSSTYNYCGDGFAQDSTGEFVVIGSVRSGSQFILIKNLSTGAETYTTTSVSGVIGYGTAPRFEVGDSLNASRHPNAGCALLATFNTALGEALARDLAQNPWQIFRPQRRVLYFNVAGGAPYTLTAERGLFTLTGIAAGLSAARKTTADAASFTLTGNDAGLKVARIIGATTGAFTFTGNAATLTYTPVGGYTMPAAAGVFTLTGVAAGLAAARKLPADARSYTLTGNAAGLAIARKLTADRQTYNLTGNAATLTAAVAARLTAETGSYSLTGNNAALVYSGASGAAGGGGVSRETKRNRQRLIVVETIDDVEELAEQVEEIIKTEPRKKLAQKVKKPAVSVQESPQAAFDWIGYYQAQLDALRDQQRAEALKRDLLRNAQIIQQIIEKQQNDAILAAQDAEYARLREEEEFLLLLMAA